MKLASCGVTFVPLHEGHLGLAFSRSEMVMVTSNGFWHCSQRNSYLGMVSPSILRLSPRRNYSYIDSGEIPPRAVEAGRQPSRDRIARSEDDRDRARRLLGRQSRRTAPGGHDDVDLESHELGGECGGSVGFPVAPSVLDGDVPSLDVAQLPQPLSERVFKAGRSGTQ